MILNWKKKESWVTLAKSTFNQSIKFLLRSCFYKPRKKVFLKVSGVLMGLNPALFITYLFTLLLWEKSD